MDNTMSGLQNVVSTMRLENVEYVPQAPRTMTFTFASLISTTRLMN